MKASTVNILIGLATLVVGAVGLWVAWAAGQPGGICAVADAPICAAPEQPLAPAEGERRAAAAEPRIREGPAEEPRSYQASTTAPTTRDYPMIEIQPGYPTRCPGGFHVHMSWSRPIDTEARNAFRRRLDAAICSDAPPPAQACEVATGICWEITYR